MYVVLHMYVLYTFNTQEDDVFFTYICGKPLIPLYMLFGQGNAHAIIKNS